MIRGIHHVSLSTRDVERLLGFYRDLLGFEMVLDTSISGNPAFDKVVGLREVEARGVFLQAGNAYIEFWEYRAPVGAAPVVDRPACDAGLTHMCLDVEDVEAVHATLSAEGVPSLSSPQHLGSVVTCYMRDPDGNLIELRQGIHEKSTLELAPEVLAASAAVLSR